MKVIYKIFNREEGENVLFVTEKAIPDVSPTEILIQIKACKSLSIDNEIIKELFVKSPRPHIPAALEFAGIVAGVGSPASTLSQGDRVAGLLPITYDGSGCAEYCVLGEYDVVKLPDDVDYVTAASSLLYALHGYTALQYMCRVTVGDVVLIIDGATTLGIIAIQLAHIWGAKVITTVSCPEEKSVLEQLNPPPEQVIMGCMSSLVGHVVEETGGLGVDAILDNGVCLFAREKDILSNGDVDTTYLTKHDLITLLSVRGQWVTSCPHLQLDPPDCDQLLLRSASVNFLFPQTWMLCPTKHGKLQHILQDFFRKLSSKKIVIQSPDTVLFTELTDKIESEVKLRIGTIVEM